MPFAKRVLGPLVGGAENVTCETCHGGDAVKRNWRMPGVRALPEPQLRLAGLERAQAVARSADAQRRVWLSCRRKQPVDGRLHAPGRDARHGEADAPAGLRLRKILRLQPLARRGRLLSLPSGRVRSSLVDPEKPGAGRRRERVLPRRHSQLRRIPLRHRRSGVLHPRRRRNTSIRVCFRAIASSCTRRIASCCTTMRSRPWRARPACPGSRAVLHRVPRRHGAAFRRARRDRACPLPLVVDVAMLAALMTLRHRITQTGANSLEAYFQPRMLAFALGAWAIAAYLRGKGTAALVLVACAFAIHPTTALWFGSGLAPRSRCRIARGGCRWSRSQARLRWPRSGR